MIFDVVIPMINILDKVKRLHFRESVIQHSDPSLSKILFPIKWRNRVASIIDLEKLYYLKKQIKNSLKKNNTK